MLQVHLHHFHNSFPSFGNNRACLSERIFWEQLVIAILRKYLYGLYLRVQAVQVPVTSTAYGEHNKYIIDTDGTTSTW